MKGRAIALAALVCAGHAVHASFELALIYDHESQGIVRYDPVTNARLGTFAQYELGTYSDPKLALNKTRPGQVAALNYDGGIRYFDYSTGIFKGMVNLGLQFYGNTPLDMQIQSNGNHLITGYYGDTFRAETRLYSPTGSLLSSMQFFSGYVPIDAQMAGDGNVYQLVREQSGSSYNFYAFRYSANGSYMGFTSLGSSSDSTATYNMAIEGDRVFTTAYSASLNVRSGKIVNGVWNLAGPSYGSWFGVDGFHDATYGHGGRGHFIQTYYEGSAYVNRWYTLDASGLNVRATRLMPFASSLGSMTMVVAPEPATMGALALGLGAVVLRRRKK